MRRLFINAVGMRTGGGVIHVTGLARAAKEREKAVVIFSDAVNPDLEECASLGIVRQVPWIAKSRWRRLVFDQLLFPLLVLRNQAAALALNNVPAVLLFRRASVFEASALHYSSPLRACFWRLVRQVSDRQLYPSHALSRLARSSNRRGLVVPHGVEHALVHHHDDVATRSLNAFFPTAPSRHKRVRDAIEALAQVHENEPQARLILTFDEQTCLPRDLARVRAFRQLAVERGVTQSVDFIGSLGRSQVHAEMARSSCTLVLSDIESFGLPVAEALALGAAVICTDIEVLREIGGEACAYVLPGDIDALSQAWIASYGSTGTRAWSRTWHDVLDDLLVALVP